MSYITGFETAKYISSAHYSNTYKGYITVRVQKKGANKLDTYLLPVSLGYQLASSANHTQLVEFAKANHVTPCSRLPETSHQSDNVELVEVDGDTPSYLDRLNAVHCEIVDLMGHKAVASEVAHIIACDYPVDDDIPPCFRSAYPVNGLAEPCNLE